MSTVGPAPVPEDLGALRRKNPIDIFDRRVEFCEYAAVRNGRRALDIEVDEDTGAYKGELPTGVEIRGHVYFLDGRLVTTPSMTGFLKNYFPGDFDAEFHARRIATDTPIIGKPGYKYYQFARDLVETVWLAADLPFEQLERGYATNPSSLAAKSAAYAEFRAVHDPVVYDALIKAWEDNGKLQSGLGKIMHRSIELFYNGNPMVGERFQTKEFGYFLDFHRDWVCARGLTMYRTELSLCYYAIRLPGMIDAMFVFDSDLESRIPIRRCVLVDWKRADDLQFTAYGDRDTRANEPFEDLPLCDGSKYYAQLNGYKCILERYTDFRVESMHIAVFHPNEERYRVHDVPDLQPQFKLCVARAAAAQAVVPVQSTGSTAVAAASVQSADATTATAMPVQSAGSTVAATQSVQSVDVTIAKPAVASRKRPELKRADGSANVRRKVKRGEKQK